MLLSTLVYPALRYCTVFYSTPFSMLHSTLLDSALCSPVRLVPRRGLVCHEFSAYLHRRHRWGAVQTTVCGPNRAVLCCCALVHSDATLLTVPLLCVLLCCVLLDATVLLLSACGWVGLGCVRLGCSVSSIARAGGGALLSVIDAVTNAAISIPADRSDDEDGDDPDDDLDV